MASTSPSALAQELLGCCLRGERRPAGLLDQLLDSDALLRIVAEGLADRFEPRLVEVYAELFSEAIARAAPELSAGKLLARYQRVRRARKFEGGADRVATVFVLSRVTLGADVAITSVLLDAAKRRFPGARVVLVGGRKAWELFAADPRIGHAPFEPVRSGGLRQRLADWRQIETLLTAPDSIVLDPDSRLTQLGLLPICPEENYYFFESRSLGGDAGDPLPALAGRWAAETLGVEGARPYVALFPAPEMGPRPVVSVSLGVGENPAKRITDPFEAELLAHLARRGMFLFVDTGAGGEETERVERAAAQVPGHRIRLFRGSFAHFASAIARSDLYVGYDSAGQHVAAASSVPLLSVFSGFSSPRMFARWRPTGPGRIEVVRVDQPDPAHVLARVLQALEALR